MNSPSQPDAPHGNIWITLSSRSIITVRGTDSREFLQGLISSDVEKLEPDRAIYGALLTPQGKFLHEFFLAERAGELLLDCEQARRDDLLRRLNLYKLRADVELVDSADTYTVVALLGDDKVGSPMGGIEGAAQEMGEGVAFVDPRLAALGARAILPTIGAEDVLTTAGYQQAEFKVYDQHRLALGIADGSRDLKVDKSVLMESNFDELHGVDFEKGCYVGQEVTTRTKRRGLVKKRLLPVDIVGPVPDPGSQVMFGEKEAGTMCSGIDGRGLALLKLEKVEQSLQSDAPLTVGDSNLTVVIPSWLDLAGMTENQD